VDDSDLLTSMLCGSDSIRFDSMRYESQEIRIEWYLDLVVGEDFY